MNQVITSKFTSINKEKFPRLYTHINWKEFNHMTVLDYGCGRYTQHIRKLMWRHDIQWYGYDPYWQPEVLNEEALECEPDIVVCSNLFNVIQDDSEVSRIHDFIRYRLCPEFFYFNVYEGDKSGIGRITKPDCWQRNQKLEDYLLSDEVIKCRIATKKGGEKFITAKEIVF